MTKETRLLRHTAAVIVTMLGVLAANTVSAPGVVHAHAPQPTEAAVSLEALIADVEARRRTTPIIGAATPIGDATVTFLARRVGGREPRVVSDATGWGEHIDGTFDFTAGTMARVGQTEWYALQVTVAPRARIEYLIAYAPTDYRVDPHNPRQTAGPIHGGALASEFAMPGYVPPPDLTDPTSPLAGRVTDTTVAGRVSGLTWRVIVHTPPGYRADATYPVAVFLDLRASQVARVIEGLIAQRAIEPIVAVFAGPASRASHDPTDAAVRTFLTADLPAWMRARDGAAWNSGTRAIIGISFGAKDALDVALASSGSPDAFDRVGLLIPGRRIGRADIDALAARRGPRVRVSILAGLYDRANLATARSLQQALATAGHAVDYTEVPEGHSTMTWMTHLREVLISLFGVAR